MTTRALCVLLGGSVIGEVTRDRRGRLTFRYESSWPQLVAHVQRCERALRRPAG